jgi:hypothetical protein
VLNRSLAAPLLALTLGLTACADPGAAPATGDGGPALAGSLAGIRAGDYTFTRSGGRAGNGAVHLPDGSMISLTGGPAVLRTGSACYLKYVIHGDQHDTYAKLWEKYTGKDKKQRAELRTAKAVLATLDGEHWVRADEKRLRAAAAEDDQSGLEVLPAAPTTAAPDASGAVALVGAVVSARRSGPDITGTLDATKIDPELGLLTNDPYYVYGPRANAMPFRATLDDQGRLTTITVDLPGALQAAASAAPDRLPSDAPTDPAEAPLVITLSKYGETPVPAAPAGAPALDPAAYEMLTNDVD